MTDDPQVASQSGLGKGWWREPQLVALTLLVVLAYFLRGGALPLRGEEPTRAQIAREMVERDDWLVPRQQGMPFGIRPPLQNWAIALSCLSLGNWDVWAIRFPSMLSTLLTTLLIYGYSRTMLTRVGALTAAAAFATMADMFQMGRQAETEALFIFLLSSSLLLWSWGWARRWPETLTWILGYGFMALATLTKGLQAPTYFVGAVVVYLALTRQWRRLFTAAHLAGAAVGGLVLAAWVLPYAQVMGWSGVHSIWFGDPVLRPEHNLDVSMFLKKLVSYPFETTPGTLPWSLMLLPFLSADFRRRLGDARPQAIYLAVCMAVALPSCWLHPRGQPRFFAPLLPCMAVLIGLAVQRCTEVDARPELRLHWRRFLGLSACAMIGLAAVVVLVSLCRLAAPALSPWAEHPLAAATFAGAALALALTMLRLREPQAPAHTQIAVAALATFLVLVFTWVGTNVRVRRSERADEAVARLKERLPPGQRLVSLGDEMFALFPYYYGLPLIEKRPWPKEGREFDYTYFCVTCIPGDRRPELPFAWEEVGAVPLDRNRRPVPSGAIVVGRRLAAGAARLTTAPR